MSREIKFRAWIKENEKFKLIKDVGIYPFKSKTECNYTISCEGIIVNQKADLIIEQFTGIHDKNGIEIYEGDIADIFGCNRTEIIYKNGAFGYIACITKNFISFVGNLNFEFEENVKSLYIEKIGTIHENPELIKEVK